MTVPAATLPERARSESARAWRRLRPLRGAVRRRLSVDARALAATRVLLATAILLDVVHRWPYLRQFYTDEGVYPRLLYRHTYDTYTGLSLHALSGDLWFQQLLAVVAALVGVALLVGYRTRLAAACSLVLLVSLNARNPAVLNGGDRLFMVLLFVVLVAPLGERWSVDALRRGEARDAVSGLVVAPLLVQPVVVFTWNAAAKHAGSTWYDGDALQVALANDAMTILLGDVIASHYGLLTVLTYAWVTLLAGSSLFLLGTAGRLRAAAALAYLGAFAGMALTMSVGLFPLLLAAAVVPYLTAPFWDALADRLPSPVVHLRRHVRTPDAGPARAVGERLVGPLWRRIARPPLERRALAALDARGHDRAVGVLVAGGRALVLVAAALVLLWILAFAADDFRGVDLPDSIDSDRVDHQHWGLYTPNPSRDYSWYVVEARAQPWRHYEALDGGEVSFDRPPDAADTYESFRHRKLMQAVERSGGNTEGPLAAGYAEWACDRAARHADTPVEQVTVYRVRQPSPIDGEYEPPTRSTVIEWDCGTSLETVV